MPFTQYRVPDPVYLNIAGQLPDIAGMRNNALRRDLFEQQVEQNETLFPLQEQKLDQALDLGEVQIDVAKGTLEAQKTAKVDKALARLVKMQERAYKQLDDAFMTATPETAHRVATNLQTKMKLDKKVFRSLYDNGDPNTGKITADSLKRFRLHTGQLSKRVPDPRKIEVETQAKIAVEEAKKSGSYFSSKGLTANANNILLDMARKVQDGDTLNNTDVMAIGQAQRVLLNPQRTYDQSSGNFIETPAIGIDPGLAKVLGLQGSEATTATGTPPIGGQPSVKQIGSTPIGVNQIKKWIHPETQRHPEVGMTIDEINAGGYVVAPDGIATIKQGFAATLSIMDELGKDVERLFEANSGFQRALQGGADKFKQFVGTDPSIEGYRSLKEGVLANIVRTFGERGTLTDQDIARARALFPKLIPELSKPLPDSRTVALLKMKRINRLLDKIWHRTLGVDYQDPDLASWKKMPEAARNNVFNAGEGEIVEFGNGQIWTIANGEPVRLR